VHAHGVFHDERLPEIVSGRNVEVANQAQAIAAEFQLIGDFAQAVFARVEGTFPAQ